MIRNYIKTALRNIARHKVYTVINISGLAVGMACAILLSLFVRDELSYDRHNSKYKRIYLVQTHVRIGNEDSYLTGSSFPIGAALRDEFSVIEESARIYSPGVIYFKDQDQEIIGEKDVCFADPEIFKILDYHFIYGTPEGALGAPGSIVLSETLSRKYFGDQNPVGKLMSRNNGVDYVVKGVFKDLPRNTFRRHSAIMSKYDLWEDQKDSAEQYGFKSIDTRKPMAFFSNDSRLATYVLLSENSNISVITDDFDRFRKKYFSDFQEQIDAFLEPIFLPLADAHLGYYYEKPGTITFNLLRVYILSSLAILILIMACINYINIATARASGRAKEVGIRKVLGADRQSLVRQFLGESMMMTMMALVVALALVELLLPSFNNLASKQIDFNVFLEPSLLVLVIVFVSILGITSGIYPAFYLSSFQPAGVFHGPALHGNNRGRLRRALVVVQFLISVTVIILTLLHREQIDYIKNLDLGFQSNSIMVITPKDAKGIASLETLENEINDSIGISATAKSSTTAANMEYNSSFEIEDEKGQLVRKSVNYLYADSDWIDLMGIEVLDGRNFSTTLGPDQSEAFLINETLAREMGWSDTPIGKRIQCKMSSDREITGHVIGVVKDIIFYSWREVPPMVIIPSRNKAIAEGQLPFLSIKLRHEDSVEVMEFIEKKWRELNPPSPFEYRFLDDIIDNQFGEYDDLNRFLLCFTVLSIFISCLGLFGLSSFSAESRTKEIAIRKVVGASTWNILLYLTFDFIKLVLISILIAAPIGYYAIAKWQELLPHKAGLHPMAVVIASSIAFAIALLTVGYHAVKASLTDPVKALKYE